MTHAHCTDCNERGHILAHPQLGCADVGCTTSHDRETDYRVVSYECAGVLMPDAAYEEVKEENRRLRHALEAAGVPVKLVDAIAKGSP